MENRFFNFFPLLQLFLSLSLSSSSSLFCLFCVVKVLKKKGKRGKGLKKKKMKKGNEREKLKKGEKKLSELEVKKLNFLKDQTLKKKSLEEFVYGLQLELVENAENSKEKMEGMATFLKPSQYSEIVEERSADNLCGLPTCSRKLNSSNKLPPLVIDKKNQRILDSTPLLSFCSKECLISSRVYSNKLNDTPLHLRQDIFLQIEKYQQNKNNMTPIDKENGIIKDRESEILKIMEKNKEKEEEKKGEKKDKEKKGEQKEKKVHLEEIKVKLFENDFGDEEPREPFACEPFQVEGFRVSFNSLTKKEVGERVNKEKQIEEKRREWTEGEEEKQIDSEESSLESSIEESWEEQNYERKKDKVGKMRKGGLSKNVVEENWKKLPLFSKVLGFLISFWEKRKEENEELEEKTRSETFLEMIQLHKNRIFSELKISPLLENLLFDLVRNSLLFNKSIPSLDFSELRAISAVFFAYIREKHKNDEKIGKDVQIGSNLDLSLRSKLQLDEFETLLEQL